MTSPCGCEAWASLDDLPVEVVGLRSPTEWCVLLGQATDILWAATGRRWRGGPQTASAVLRAAPPRAGEGAWPYHSSWGHCPCFAGAAAGIVGWADGHYRHAAPAAIRLPHPDVTAVQSVTVDGAPFTAWRLDGAWLARTDRQGWPVCHDRAEVTYTYGRTPPDGGKAACVELAVELARASVDDPDRPCRLPQRLQSVTRQGLTFAALDDMEFISKGLTGISSIDMWVRSVNPYGRPRAARVWSPDLMRARKTP